MPAMKTKSPDAKAGGYPEVGCELMAASRSGVGLRSKPGITATAWTFICAPGTGSASTSIHALGCTVGSRLCRTT